MDEWRGQKVEYIPLNKLVLWSENPRDPLGEANNEETIQRALKDDSGKPRWKLASLSKEMGSEFDFSELPTVVYQEENDEYIVFDGNRRVILALLRARGEDPQTSQLSIPHFPDAIPCNVCLREKAIEHVYRKHESSGSWNQYERDLFVSNYMGEKKSILVRLEELVGAITSYPNLNQRYIKEDVLNDKHLKELGLDPAQRDYGISSELLLDIVKFVASEATSDGLLSTRRKRNAPKEVFPQELLSRIAKEVGGQAVIEMEDGTPRPEANPHESDDENDSAQQGTENKGPNSGSKKNRKTKTSNKKKYEVFGGSLCLIISSANDLYRTLDALWVLYEKDKLASSSGFVQLFRMGLRLLVETASNDLGKKDMDDYIECYFGEGKKLLKNDSNNPNATTFLASNSVTRNNLKMLLHVGAHNYDRCDSKDQTIAISLIVGAMLKASHSKTT